MKQPLLLEEVKLDNGSFAINDGGSGNGNGSLKDSFSLKSPTSARRITPRSMTIANGGDKGKNKTPTNPLKQ